MLPHKSIEIAAAVLLTGGAVVTPSPSMAVAAQVQAAPQSARVASSLVQIYIDWWGFVGYLSRDGGTYILQEVRAQIECSGAFVSTQGHILTAGHCLDLEGGRTSLILALLNDLVASGEYAQDEVDRLQPEALKNWKVQGYEADKPIVRRVTIAQDHRPRNAVLLPGESRRAVVLSYELLEQGDVALIRTSLTDTPALQVAATAPQPGARVAAYGFAGTPSLTSYSGVITGTGATATGTPMLEMTTRLDGGMSGGPTVDEQGNIVGVNSHSVSDGSQMISRISETDKILAALKQAGV